MKAERNVLAEINNPYVVKLFYSFQVKLHPSPIAAVHSLMPNQGFEDCITVHARWTLTACPATGILTRGWCVLVDGINDFEKSEFQALA